MGTIRGRMGTIVCAGLDNISVTIRCVLTTLPSLYRMPASCGTPEANQQHSQASTS